MEFQRKWRKIDREFQRAAYNSKIQLTVRTKKTKTSRRPAPHDMGDAELGDLDKRLQQHKNDDLISAVQLNAVLRICV